MSAKDILNQTLMQNAQQIQQAANNPRQADMLNIARERNNTLATENEILSDRENLAPYDFYRKYGDEVTRNTDILDLRHSDLRSSGLNSRTPSEYLTDSLVNIGTGINQLAGTAAHFTTGLLGPNARISAARGNQAISDGINSFSSKAQKLSQERSSIISELDKQDNRKQYEEDLKTLTPLQAGTRRVLRDIATGTNQVFESPDAAFQGITQGIGSMIAGAGFGRLLAGAVNTALGITSATTVSSMPVAIGLMEGSGAYNQVVNEIMEANPSHEDLMKDSPRYANYINKGYSPQEARTATIDDAGKMAMYIQGPLAGATGALVARFEANPLASVNPMQALSNIGRETLEEGVQSFTGSVSGNVGKQQADQNQDLFEDVGVETAQGAIFGFGTAGSIQAPGMAARPVINAGRTVAGVIPERARRVREQVSKASPVSSEAINQAEAELDLETVANTISTTPVEPVTDINTAEDVTAQTNHINNVIEDINNSVNISEAEISSLPEDILEATFASAGEGNIPNRRHLLETAANIISDDNASEDSKLTASLIVLDQQRRRNSLQAEDMNIYGANVDTESEGFKAVSGYFQYLNNLSNNPAIKQATEAAHNFIVSQTQNQVTTPEQATKVADLAGHVPENIDPVIAERILEQNTQGELDLTPAQIDNLTSSIHLNNAGKMFQNRTQPQEVVPETESPEPVDFKPYEIVSRQIANQSGDAPHMKSMAQHVNDINSAVRANNIPLAKANMKSLNNFAQHMINKVNAFNESLAEGNGSPKNRKQYDVLGPDGTFFRSPKYSHWANVNHENSMNFANTVLAEAEALVQLSNNMSLMHPELEGTTLETPSLLAQAAKQESVKEVKPEPVAKKDTVKQPEPVQGELVLEMPVETTPVVEKATVEPVKEETKQEQTSEEVNEADGNPSINVQQDQKDTLKGDELLPIRTASQTPTRKRGTAQAVLEDYADRLKGRVTKIVKHSFKNQLAGYNPKKKTIFIDVDKIEEDFKSGLKYLAGIHGNETSKQKQIVFEDVNITAFREHILKGGVEMYAKFIIEHELQHVRQLENRGEVYPRTNEGKFDLMHKDAIRLERDANEAGFKAIGFDPKARAITQEGQASKVVEPVTTEPEGKSFFSNLYVPESGVNQFTKAFSYPEKQRSRIQDFVSPIEDLSLQVENPRLISEDKSINLTYKVDRDARTAWGKALDLAKVVSDVLSNTVSQQLDRKRKNGGSLRQDIESGKDVTRWYNGRIANLLDKDLNLDKQIADVAGLAAVEMMVNGERSVLVKSEQDIRDSFGISEDITGIDEFVTAVNSGMSRGDYADTLSRIITKFLGVRTNNNASESYTKGIPQALATTLLDIMIDNGMVTEIEMQVPGSVTTYKGIVTRNTRDSVNRDNTFVDIVSGVEGTPNLLNDLVLIEKSREHSSIGENLFDLPYTQRGNEYVPTTREQRESVDNQQNTPNYLNKPFYDLVNGMGLEQYIVLGGGQIIDNDTPMNVNTRASIEGKNLTLTQSYNAIKKQYAELEAYKTDKDISDIEVFYQYAVIKNGRTMTVGINTPQNDKGMRQVMMPNRSYLDMNNPEDSGRFWLTIAQGIGIKTEILRRPDAVMEAIAQTSVDGKYNPIIETLIEVINGKPVPADFVANVHAVDAGISLHGIDSLLSVARLRDAIDKGQDLSNYRYDGYLEADGKTNGPIMALALLKGGHISADYIKLLRKGGISIGERDISLNKHVNERDGDDLYKSTGVKGSQNLAETHANLMKHENIRGHVLAMQRMLRHLNMDISMSEDGNSLIIERGATKNPLTITIYGSGVDGIAAKAANELLNGIYAAITEAMQSDSGTKMGDVIKSKQGEVYGHKQFSEDFMLLLGSSVARNKEGELYLKKPKYKSPKEKTVFDNPEKFTVSATDFKTFATNVRELYISGISEAINTEVNSQIASTTAMIQQMTGIQSAINKALFAVGVNEVYEQKLASGEINGTEFISANDMKNIMKDILKVSPYISSGNQNLLFGGRETVYVNRDGTAKIPQYFGKALNDAVAMEARMFSPGLAGVAGTPGIVIAKGDANMMQKASTGKDRVEKTTLIFDGGNMAADRIDIDGIRFNKAVHEVIQENPFEDVFKAFTTMAANNPIERIKASKGTEKILETLTADINAAYMGVVKAEPTSIENAIGTLRLVAEGAEYHNDTINALIKAMAPFDMSVDQMASTDRAYTYEGTRSFDENTPPEVIAEAINKEYDIEFAKLRKSKEAIEPSTEAFVKSMEDFSYAEGDVRIATPESIELMYQNIKDTNASKDQKTLAIQTAKKLKGLGIKIVIGEPEALNIYAGSKVMTNNAAGVYLPDSKLLLITNASNETLLHEMIHAATFQIVDNYINDPGSVDTTTGNSVAHIRELMYEWLSSDAVVMDNITHGAYSKAYAAITNALYQGQEAVAINEFMAWNLSNHNLIAQAKLTNTSFSLARLAKDVLASIKKLIWGDGKAPKVNDSVYSNLRFSTQVIMNNPENAASRALGVALYQSTAYGTNDRISNMSQTFISKFRDVMNRAAPLDKKDYQYIYDGNVIKASEENAALVSAGFNFDMQQKSAFNAISAITDTYKDLNSNAMGTIGDIHASVIKQIKASDFLADPETNNPARLQKADQQLNAVMNSDTSTFLALAMVSDDFRTVLNKLDLPKSERDATGTLDGRLDNLGTDMMDKLTSMLDGTGKAKNITQAMDILAVRLNGNTANSETFIERTSTGVLDKTDKLIRDTIDNVASKVVEITDNRTDNEILNKGKAIAGALARMIDSGTAKEAQEGIIAGLNNTDAPFAIKEFIIEIMGRIQSNSQVFDLISKARATIQQIRQQHVERLPDMLASKFKRTLTRENWEDLQVALGATSVGSIIKRIQPNQLRELLADQTAVDTRLAELKDIIKDNAIGHDALIIKKADELATYLVSKKVPNNFLRNPFAIANLYGEVPLSTKVNINEDMVNNIEEYVALSAWNQQSKEVKQSVTSLLNEEAEGTEFLLSYLAGSIKSEMDKIKDNVARNNYLMGNMPHVNQQDTNLIVANDSEYDKLILMGYTRVANYHGSDADINRGNMSYYYSDVSGMPTYNQGVLQTVRQTASGVDPLNGFTTGELIAGRITDPKIVRNITARLKGSKTTTEQLMPIRNSNGVVIAYERSIAPEMLQYLNRDQHLGRTIGIWRGRQVEELMSREMNNTLLNILSDQWKEAKKSHTRNQYVDISRSNDPIYMDIWKTIPQDTKNDIKALFGEEGFPIRKDMVTDAVGVRSASIGDAWTDNTRWSPEVTKRIKDTASGLFGVNAYKYLVNTEKALQNLVSDAKVLIVVKSVIVPVANMVANIFQLTNRGVPIRIILKGIGERSAELNIYTKRKYREIELEGELFAAEARHDVLGSNRAKAQLKAIRAANTKLSIWPLIEAGEYNAITEGGITQEDLAIADGKWSNYVEKAAASLPAGMQTPFRYAMVSKDTSLFKGLAKSVQYGDFLAKSILYDHERSKGASHEDALGATAQAFINYNRFTGRNGGYLDSIGLRWFWSFKLRIMKEALYLVKNNPARSLLMGLTSPAFPMIGSVGSPLFDNFGVLLANGKLSYSIGPSMGLRAPSLNPWWALFGD